MIGLVQSQHTCRLMLEKIAFKDKVSDHLQLGRSPWCGTTWLCHLNMMQVNIIIFNSF